LAALKSVPREQFVAPDILCLAKSLAGGIPMGAVLCSDRISVPVKSHTSTFGGNPTACAAALASIEVIENEKLVNQAKAMMNLFPDDAAAVIVDFLVDLTQRIDQLRLEAPQSKIERDKERMFKQATSLAQAAQMLAELLLDWAVRQGLSEEDLVPYKLILAKAMVLAGKSDGALGLLKPLLENNGDAPILIDATAEALFVKGDRASLVEAAGLYDRLIGGLPRPHPPMWWKAWLRRLQIIEKIGDEWVKDIPLRVRALEREDPTLGGELYRPEFKRLELKYSR